jgi:hypothetical protein
MNAVLGGPLWGTVANNDGNRTKDEPYLLPLDSLLWAMLNIYVHGSSLVCLFLDERVVPLTDDEAALWRLFYRTAGMSSRLFARIIQPHLTVVTLEPDTAVPTDDYFFIIYRGHIQLAVYDKLELQEYEKLVSVDGASSTPLPHLLTQRSTGSGECFDLKYLGNVYEVNKDEGGAIDESTGSSKTGRLPRAVFQRHTIRCTTRTACTLFRFNRKDLHKITSHPFAKQVWQALLISNLSFLVEAYLCTSSDAISYKENTNQHHDHRRFKHDYCDRIFAPLQPWEEPLRGVAGSGTALQNPLQHVIRYIRSSFSPPWPFVGHPTGIRQTMLRPPPQRNPHRVDDAALYNIPYDGSNSLRFHRMDEEDLGAGTKMQKDSSKQQEQYANEERRKNTSNTMSASIASSLVSRYFQFKWWGAQTLPRATDAR